MKTGIELITEEREKQLKKWNAEHDSGHENGELLIAATMLASPCVTYVKFDYANSFHFEVNAIDWDLDIPRDGNVIKNNNVYGSRKRINQLKVAGALIAAEIDRLQNINP